MGGKRLKNQRKTYRYKADKGELIKGLWAILDFIRAQYSLLGETKPTIQKVLYVCNN